MFLMLSRSRDQALDQLPPLIADRRLQMRAPLQLHP